MSIYHTTRTNYPSDLEDKNLTITVSGIPGEGGTTDGESSFDNMINPIGRPMSMVKQNLPVTRKVSYTSK